jgi:16S rRNA (cytidine1402-2'-O)-methyltransferase
MSGQLVIVATPIGNLADVSRRVLDVLEQADVVYCEDTRHSRTLFAAYEIPSGGRLFSLHQHNEASQCDEIVRRVGEGQTVALISDAGTPGISDPGTRVVAAVAQAGLIVSTAPGPSAVVAALSISGLPTERFCMEGFLPRKQGERAQRYETWSKEPRTIVFFESPQRIVATIKELADRFGERRVVIARELTKRFEEVLRGSLTDVAAMLADREMMGEIVVVLDGAGESAPVDDETVLRAIRDELAGGLSLRDAATGVARDLGISQRRVYEMALADRDNNPS